MLSSQFSARYFSPYPLAESEADDGGASHAPASSAQAPRIPGVHRATVRSHGRTSDLLAGGLGRTHGVGERSILWVCDRCFKYMADGLSWELHVVRRPFVWRWSLAESSALSRGSALAGIRPGGRSISAVLIQFGRLMVRRTRCVHLLVTACHGI